MIHKEFTCVVCPNGCSVDVTYTNENGKHKIIKFSGNKCPRGEVWVRQEIENPMRTFSTSVSVDNCEFPGVSVRITKPVPLTKIFEVMDEIRSLRVSPPLHIGQVLLKNPAGTETTVIVTRNIGERK